MNPVPDGDCSSQQVFSGWWQRERTTAAVFQVDHNRDKSVLCQRLEDCRNRRALSAETFGDRTNPPCGCPPEQDEELKLSAGQLEQS